MNGEQRRIHYKHIYDNMNKDQLAIFSSYMNIFQNYLNTIDASINPPEITIPSTNKIYCQMDDALWAVQPKAEYNLPQPWRHKIYFSIAWIIFRLALF